MRKYFINHLVYTLLQLTWGVFQNAIGILIFLILTIIKPNRRRAYYHGAIISYWRFDFSMGCGMFIFFGHYKEDEDFQSRVLCHEYGHTIQSIILGPLFMFVVAIPSCVWAFTPCFVKLRLEGKKSYFDLYCEAWANSLGEAVLHIDAPRRRLSDK